MEPYTEEELFNLRHVVVEANTQVDRFKCVLTCKINGSEEILVKRKWNVKDIKGEGYIGFDAYNHYVDSSLTRRIRITYVGEDYVCVFVRSFADQDNRQLIRVKIGEPQELTSINCENGVTYTLSCQVKPKDDF